MSERSNIIGSILAFLGAGAIVELVRRLVPSRDKAADIAEKRFEEQDRVATQFRDELRDELNRQKLEIRELREENKRCEKAYRDLEEKHDAEVLALTRELETLRWELRGSQKRDEAKGDL